MSESDGFESADDDTVVVPAPDKPTPNEPALEEPVLVSEPDKREEPNPPKEDPPVRPPSPEIKPDPAPPEPSPTAPIPTPSQPSPAPAKEDWGWGNWSTWAASSVSNVTDLASKTTKGLSGALETFEASLGLPTPEELAKEMRESQLKEGEMAGMEGEEKSEETAVQKDSEIPPNSEGTEAFNYLPGAGLWSGLTSFSATSTQYLTTGLEALDKISNQAYEALNDQSVDSQPRKTRIRDTNKGTSLMAVLQDAKGKYDHNEKISAETKRTMAYLFDEKQGLSQLEALEMLSKECVHKMKGNSQDATTLFVYIETSLELKSGDSEIIIEHLGAAVTDCLKTLKIELPIAKLNQCRFEIAQQLSDMDMTSLDETAAPSDTKAVATLDNSLHFIASFAARSVELFKKIAELSLLKSHLEVDMKTQADTIKFLNEVLCCELDNIREQLEGKMEKKEDVDVLYLETSNAVSYLQETLYYFVPILKWVVVKTSRT